MASSIVGGMDLLAQLSAVAIVGIAVGAFFVLLILWFVAVYNGLVRMRMQVKNGWSQIDVQLKRRHDLIPNLVEACKGYMGFEKEVLENVTKARSEAMKVSGQGAGAQAGAEGMLTAALGRLYVVMENYPDLKASQNVSQLMEELTSTENRIAFARQHYNDEVLHYNTAIRQIPKNIVAGVGGFTAESFFEIEEKDREVPKVDLSM
jgi:LemA protein